MIFEMHSSGPWWAQEAATELKSYAMAEIAPTEEAPGGWQWVVEGVGLTQASRGGPGGCAKGWWDECDGFIWHQFWQRFEGKKHIYLDYGRFSLC